MERHKQAIKLLIIIIALAGIIISIGYSSSRKPSTAANRLVFARTKERLERGRYIVEGPAHCFQCHSDVDWKNPGAQPKPGKKVAFGGGLKFTGPWGVVSSANITQDASGISYYDEALFVKTLRTGQVGARSLKTCFLASRRPIRSPS